MLGENLAGSVTDTTPHFILKEGGFKEWECGDLGLEIGLDWIGATGNAGEDERMRLLACWLCLFCVGFAHGVFLSSFLVPPFCVWCDRDRK